MKTILLIALAFPFTGWTHPGVGIVKDSKGNIYYTDLQQVWKITNSTRTVVVPNAHTHELYIDNNDNLYGEGGYYDEKTKKFYHYLWVYRPNGIIDTVLGMKEAYILQDFSLARDKRGNEYYIKRFLKPLTDTNHIYRSTPEGNETIFATGNFKSVNWLHPQDDGSLLYVSDNAIYRVDSLGTITLLKENVAAKQPSFSFSGSSMIWGVWQDKARNIYAAVFSDQKVRRIDANGNISDVHTSAGNWTPLHGVFDNNNRLWVLEGSDKNEVRVSMVEKSSLSSGKTGTNLLTYIIVSGIVLGIIIFFVKFRKPASSGLREMGN